MRGVTNPSYLSVSVGSGDGTIAVAFYNIKEALKTAGWTVDTSGDGLSAYSASSDVITGSGSGANGMNNAKAWLVLKAPGAVGGSTRRLCLQMVSTLQTAASMRIKYSLANAFSGGSPSATVTPSATSEVVIRGGGTDASPTGQRMFSDATAGTHLVYGVADQASPYGFMYAHVRTSSTGDLAEMRFGLDPLVSPPGVDHSGDTDQFMIHASGSAGNTWNPADISALSQTAGTNDPPTGRDSAGTYSFFAPLVMNEAAGSVPIELPNLSTSAGDTPVIPADGWTTNKSLVPVIYVNKTSGIKGVSTMLHAFAQDYDTVTGTSTYLRMYTVNSQTASYIRAGAYVFPWRGTAPGTGTWATDTADIWTLSPDQVAPTVVFTPSSGVIAQTDSIQIDVTDDENMLKIVAITASYGSGYSYGDESVYNGSAFGSQFTNGTNATSAITNGTRYVVKRDGSGWPTASLVLKVLAVDKFGNTSTTTSSTFGLNTSILQAEIGSATADGYEVSWGGGTPAPSPPVISNLTPANNTQLGGTQTPIEFDVTDADPGLLEVILWLKFGNQLRPWVVHDTVSFWDPFDRGSSRTAIANGWHFKLVPNGVWLDGAISLTVRAVDQRGAAEGSP